MKKTLTAACAAILLASCAGTGSRTAAEQTATTTEETATTAITEPAQEMIAGGYSQQRDLTPEELELFKTVTAEIDGVNYTPESVSTQVVAGKNYRFICKAVTVTAEPQTYQAEVTVFQPLPHKQEAPRITSIKKL